MHAMRKSVCNRAFSGCPHPDTKPMLSSISVRLPVPVRPLSAGIGLALAAALVAAGDGYAQNFPVRPVRIVIPVAAGGAVDALTRIFAQKLSEAWSQQVIVDNRAGAGGNIGIDLVAKAAPDGYTYLVLSQSFAVNISVYKDLPWHPVRDFSAVMLIASTNGVLLVPPALAAQSPQELIALAKAQPGRLSYASTGSGTSGHMNMALFTNLTGIDVVHVPYKDVTQAQTDLMGGRVQLYIAPMPGFVALIRAGKMRALAVTGARRSDALPGVPTLQESGVPGYEAVTWYGMYAPARTPRAIIAKTHAELTSALQKPDVRERYAALGLDIVASSPEYLAKYLQEEVVKWANVVKTMKLRAD